MRSVSQAILNKLQKNIQTQSTDADPKLQIIATQSTYNTLLSEVIHSNAAITRGDVAVRQLEGEASPSLAYAICIDKGVAKLYDRRMPTSDDYPWNYVFDVAAAEECAIEFNGIWQLEAKSQEYYLATELTPYLFFVQSGILYVQKWNDEETRIPLAEGVSDISVCRAWQSSYDLHLDQGLVVGYLKNGAAYYRAFCFEQESKTVMWEGETEITELGSGLKSICTFRTNDFRVGFVCEADGEFRYVLSARSYAGQSVRPEMVYVEVNSNAMCRMVEVYRKTVNCNAHSVTVIPSVPPEDYYLGYCMEYPTITPIPTRLSKTEFRIFLGYPLIPKKPLEKFITISTEDAKPKAASVVVEGDTLTITTDIEILLCREVTMTLSGRHMLLFESEQATPLLVPDFTVVFSEEDIEVPASDSVSVIPSYEQTLKYINVTYSNLELSDENITVNFSCSSSLTMTLVGTVPI